MKRRDWIARFVAVSNNTILSFALLQFCPQLEEILGARGGGKMQV